MFAYGSADATVIPNLRGRGHMSGGLMSRGQRLALNGPRCSVCSGGWLAVCIQNTGTLVEFGTVWFLRYTRGGGQTEHWDDTASVPRYITFPYTSPTHESRIPGALPGAGSRSVQRTLWCCVSIFREFGLKILIFHIQRGNISDN